MLLHTWIMQDWAFIFSPADVSWLGMYGFLIAVDTGLISEWGEQERLKAKKARRLAWLGPIVVIIFHAIYFMLYPEIWLNYLIYCVALSVLGYHAFLMFFASSKKTAIQSSMQAYHAAVLFFLIAELILFLVTCFYYPLILYYVLLFVVTAALSLMVSAASKGDLV